MKPDATLTDLAIYVRYCELGREGLSDEEWERIEHVPLIELVRRHVLAMSILL